MPATTLTKTTAPSVWSTTGQAVTMAAADVANGNDFVAAGEMVLIAYNSDASNPYTVTVTSQPDAEAGRSGDVAAVSLAANEIRVFLLTADGWADANGKINIQGENAAIKFGVVQL